MHHPRFRLAFSLLAAVALGGCRTGAPAVPPATTPPATTPPVAAPASQTTPAGAAAMLSAAAASYWNGHLEANPLEATELGDRRFDDQLPDLSPAGQERETEQLIAQRALAKTVPPGPLSDKDRVTRALLIGQIDAEIARNQCRLEEWSVDARDGLQVAFLRLPELQPVRTVEEGRKLAARWQKMGPTIGQEIANLRRGLAAGKVATAEEVRRVLAQLDELLSKPNDKWPLREPAAAPHPDWPAADRQALARDVDRAIADGVRPAFERYRDLLRSEILPRARDEAHAGIMNVPGGAACYAKLIEVHTSLQLPAQEIHKIGLEELARIQGEIARVGQQAFGTGALPEIRKRLQGDRASYFKTRDEILNAARAALARAQAAQPRFLGRLPRTPCVVKAIDAFEEKDAPIAYYRPAAIDGTRPGTYYVNTSQPETRPRYEFEALTFHESVPGHHVQIALAQELTGLPEFRKQSGVTAFVEGWGLYAEGLADQLGLYSSPLERLGRLNFDAWRALRLIVDTGIHALGWSRSRAITFMEENAVLTHGNVVNEVDRYIAWPGQALAYKLGEREIRGLRAEAERRLGPAFDLRAFHDVVLGGGAVSLPVLRDQVDAWVRAQKPPAPQARAAP